MNNWHTNLNKRLGQDSHSSNGPNNHDPETLPETDAVPQRIIGLTGGIGMGKSTVSRYLEQRYHIPVIDADLLSRDAVTQGTPILAAIAQRYGQAILRPNGELDRARLADIVFQCSSERLWLDQQIHPYVRHRIETALSQPETLAPIILLAIPLLFEARMTDLATEIWVVWCDREQQIDRIIQRSVRLSQQDGTLPLSREQVIARIQTQMDIQKKIRHANVVLDNSRSLENLYCSIDQAIGVTDPSCLKSE
ncbi:MAG: dephospho-CoA kinase [Leptolyngbyaceae bacterium]|nr:dephospho-CoA kinase [Leptolyngbyaceae bacterium]